VALAIPTKLEAPLVRALDSLVAEGLYQSRSEAIRDATRRLVARNYMSRVRFLTVIAQVSAQLILDEYGDIVTDIILYGSVAIGRVSDDSDIDLLILVSDRLSKNLSEVEIRIHEIVYPVALSSDAVITPIVLNKNKFQDLIREGQHFATEIVKHGIEIKGAILNELRKSRLSEKSRI
jgi:Arc/MetJ-type ribon-helix-helix transcriptional regulator